MKDRIIIHLKRTVKDETTLNGMINYIDRLERQRGDLRGKMKHIKSIAYDALLENSREEIKK